MKKTCFHEVNLAAGAKMVEMFGYYLPLEYASGGKEEHIGTRLRVSLCDLDYMAEFKITGNGSEEFLHKLLTTDVKNQKIGQIKYTAICDDNGLMQDDGTIWKFSDQSFVLITGDEGDEEWIIKESKGFEVTIENITTKWTTLALQGPKAADVLEKAMDVNTKAIRFNNFIETKFNGFYCIVDRMGYTGSGGFELHFDSSHAKEVWNKLMECGKKYDIVPCGQMALESLRQEAGYLLVGNEHSKEINPIEAGIDFVVKLDKDDFNGKSALLQIAKEGVSKKLVWFKLKNGEVAKTGDLIYLYGKQISTVTSGSYSPTYNQGTAMGYVPAGCTNTSFSYTIMIDGKSAIAKMSSVPLYDQDNTTTQGLTRK